MAVYPLLPVPATAKFTFNHSWQLPQLRRDVANKEFLVRGNVASTTSIGILFLIDNKEKKKLLSFFFSYERKSFSTNVLVNCRLNCGSIDSVPVAVGSVGPPLLPLKCYVMFHNKVLLSLHLSVTVYIYIYT